MIWYAIWILIQKWISRESITIYMIHFTYSIYLHIYFFSGYSAKITLNELSTTHEYIGNKIMKISHDCINAKEVSLTLLDKSDR